MTGPMYRGYSALHMIGKLRTNYAFYFLVLEYTRISSSVAWLFFLVFGGSVSLFCFKNSDMRPRSSDNV